MLVLHSSSRCDVCLLEYTWETPANAPHAIACGHIFCRDCLYSMQPPLCPLCRKLYQPAKIKKLHVDKPEDIDDHKELDLLQRLAISWDLPEDQLEDVTYEVDAWLEDREDDACIALRKSRAALVRNRELKEAESSLEEMVQSLEEEKRQLDNNIVFEQTKLRVTTEAYSAKIDRLEKENYYLKSELETLQANQRHQSRNPLPPPPEPIPIEHIPSFAQAVSDPSVRFTDFPSPRFEVESRSSRKGKSKATMEQHNDPRYQPHASISSNSHYVHPHVNQSTRGSGLQMQFDSTTQPLDVYALTSAYLREYSSGFVEGQLAAAEPAPARPTHASGSNRHSHPPATAVESSYRNEHITSSIYQNQPYSAPAARSSQPTHGRQETVSSIVSSGSSSNDVNANGRSSSRSRSRSRPYTSAPSVASSTQINNPVLSSILTNNPGRPPSVRRSTAASSSIYSPQLSRALTDTQAPRPVPPPTPPLGHFSAPVRPSPSVRSHQTIDTWGTQTPSHLASGSLISGLYMLRDAPQVSATGGQPEPHGVAESDAASILTHDTRDTTFSNHTSESVPRAASPVRQVDSMVGVLSPVASVDARLERRPSPYRSPTFVERRLRRVGWGSSDRHSRTSASTNGLGGYMTENEIMHNQEHSSSTRHRNSYAREERGSSHRSRTSMGSYSYFPDDDHWPQSNEHGQLQENAASAASDARSNMGRFNGGLPPPGTAPVHAPAPVSVSTSSNDRHRDTRAHRSMRPRNNRSMPLPESESPFPITVESTDDERGSYAHASGRGISSPGGGQPALQSFGNALGLELTTGPPTISAPTPVASTQRFLRSFSRDHYEP